MQHSSNIDKLQQINYSTLVPIVAMATFDLQLFLTFLFFLIVCQADEFRCLKYPECVHNSLQCDGIKQCRDGSDEWYQCPTTTQPPRVKGILFNAFYCGKDGSVLLILIDCFVHQTFCITLFKVKQCMN